MKKDNKIDIIIPAYKANKTILKTVSSIASQTIVKDVTVTIVDDHSPKGYANIVDTFSPYMDIREVRLDKNGGPGVARQYGLENTTHEFVTFIDADDTFAGPDSLEMLRDAITSQKEYIKCVSSGFLQMSENAGQVIPHLGDMVWVFGKMYRRSFLEKYDIRFAALRANEDTGFNTWVRLLCNTPEEQLIFIEPVTYYWHNTERSITRINDGQYGDDQCFCGWVDNMIWVYDHIMEQRKNKLDDQIVEWITGIMLNCYYSYLGICHRHPVFKEQDFEYIKKFYERCYKKVIKKQPKMMFDQMFTMSSAGFYQNPVNLGIIPDIGIKEFLTNLENEPYDPEHIYDIWEKMEADPETAKLIKNNIECGVCPKGYTKRRNK